MLIVNLLAAAVALAPNNLTKVEVQITTANDDLRSDSRAAVQIDYSHATRQAKPISGRSGFAAGSDVTATFTPPAGTKVENLQQIGRASCRERV
mgnify:CR=1 FL=1